MSNWPVISPTGLLGGGYLFDGAVTGGATVTSSFDSKGSWVEVVAACPFDTTEITLYAANTSYGIHLLDIGVGAAASEVVVVPDIWGNIPFCVTIPLEVSRGQRIAVRIAGTSPFYNATAYIGVDISGASFLSPAAPQKMARLAAPGVNDAGGTANTFSAWVEVTSSLPFAARYLAVSVQAGGDNTGRGLWQVGVGAASSEIVVANGWVSNPAYYGYQSWRIVPVALPAGTRVAFRHCATSTASSSVRNMPYVLYALG